MSHYLVDDLSVLQAVFDRYFTKQTRTNNYVLIEDYAAYIAQSKLSVVEQGQNAFLFIDKGNCYRMYYFINDSNAAASLKLDKPIATEVLYRGEKNFPQAEVAYWKANAFIPHLGRDCFFLKKADANTSGKQPDSSVSIKAAASTEDSKVANRLIDKYLDPFTGDPLSLEALEGFRAEGHLLCAYAADGEVCGILQATLKNSVYWLGHLVVDGKYRGQKIALRLTQAYLSKGEEIGCRQYQLWVIKNNLAAVNLYRKLGFNYLHKSTISLLKI